MLKFAFIASLVSIAYGLYIMWSITRKPTGNAKMQEIAKAIEDGANAYMKREGSAIAMVGVVLALILWKFLGAGVASGFVVGAVASLIAGYIGMYVATKSNVRIAEVARAGAGNHDKGLSDAFGLAFRGGSVTGFMVGGLALLSLATFYYLTNGNLASFIGLGFGGSLVSVFARLGGGIFTKAADVGADLVGKVESGIPEDDPRNPAVIADLVGDNVGDTKGMAADIFETYVVSAIAVMLLGSLLFPGQSEIVLLPLFIGALASFASIIGSWFVKLSGGSIMWALYKGLILTAILAVMGFFYFIVVNPIVTFATLSGLAVFWSLCVGIGVTALIFVITDYYTSKKYSPVQSIAQASTTGHGTNIITGLSVSQQATVAPVVIIVLGIALSFYFAGLYGIALAVMSMLSLTAIIVSIDAFGPITDNAGGIAEMSGLPDAVRAITDPLDAVGNTTKAVTKGYAIASAGMAALVLFSAYTEELAKLGSSTSMDLGSVKVIIGLFIGGIISYLFSSLAMGSVGKAAGSIVEEVRRQFREIPGLMAGTGKPDYKRAVDIATKSAIKEMILPALLPVLVPIVVGVVLGPKALGGLLVGLIVTGVFMAIAMTSGGAAWDNAKKHIEDGHHGGKKSPAHQAAVTGDTVGDPYKDTAGPAINPMIKVANIVALLIVPFIV